MFCFKVIVLINCGARRCGEREGGKETGRESERDRERKDR